MIPDFRHEFIRFRNRQPLLCITIFSLIHDSRHSDMNSSVSENHQNEIPTLFVHQYLHLDS
jgi:hypothetical protein